MKLKNGLSLLLFCFIAFCYFSPVMASASPEGTWKTIDDNTNKARGVIKLYVINNVLYGKVIKTFLKSGNNPLCEKCSGNFKNKPMIGLQNIWGLKKVSDLEWSGGKILEPATGKIYSCSITLNPNNQQLVIHGYLGVSLLGRTQTWIRMSN